MEIFIFIIALFSAMVIHECAHGWVAFKCGDPTAKEAGRLTLNPLKHIDPVGTVYLPAALIALRMMGVNIFVFGWAKPVPVNFFRLRNPKRDMMWVGLAGPASNILFASILFLLLKVCPFPRVCDYIGLFIIVNLLLAVFNMVPIPPLDGSRFVMGLLPNAYAARYARLEPYGMLIVIVLLYFGLFERVVWPVALMLGNFLGVHLL